MAENLNIETQLIEELSKENYRRYEGFCGIRWKGYNAVSEEFFIDMLNRGLFELRKVKLNLQNAPYSDRYTHTFVYKEATFLTCTKLLITEL